MPSTKKEKKKYFIEKHKNIIIEFDKLYNDPDLEQYNHFRLAVSKKRIYLMASPFICSENNKVLNSINPEVRDRVLYNILCIKRAINEKHFVKNNTNHFGNEAIKDFGKYENFINNLITNLFTKEFISEIKKYVNNNYIPSHLLENKEEGGEPVPIPTPIISNTSKFYQGTTFTEEHFKLLHCVAIMIRFVIPLGTHYVFENSDKNVNLFRFLYTIFDAIFKIVVVGTECTDLLNKLTKYVERMVYRTGPTNKLLWDMLISYNTTKESVVNDIMIKLLTSIFPKFEFSRRIVSLIYVVTRETVKTFILGAKHPYATFKLNDSDNISDEEDKLSDSDIFDLHYRPHDEAMMVFKKYCNADAIEVIRRRNNINISKEELDFYEKTIEIHHFSVTMVTQVFARFFSGANNVRSCTKREFVTLIIILIKKMRVFGIEHLPRYITGIRTSFSFTRTPNKTLLNALRNDFNYDNLINNKYKFVKNVFNTKTTEKESRNPIKDNIVTLIHNNYVYNDFEYPELNGAPIVKDEELIMKDIISVYKLMIV